MKPKDESTLTDAERQATTELLDSARAAAREGAATAERLRIATQQYLERQNNLKKGKHR